MQAKTLKNWIPPGVKRVVGRVLQTSRFRQAMGKMKRLPTGQVPTREILRELSTGWGNEGYSANLDYLEEVALRAAGTRGHILECGTGLTTILLGLLAGRQGSQVWSLEHSPQWGDRIQRVLKRHHILGVQVLSHSLRQYEGFCWYDPSNSVLPDEFSLVVCDGPPGDTPGGRYGLFPVLGDRIREGAIILLDDANRPDETAVLNRWEQEFGLDVRLYQKSEGKFAVVERRGPTT